MSACGKGPVGSHSFRPAYCYVILIEGITEADPAESRTVAGNVYVPRPRQPRQRDAAGPTLDHVAPSRLKPRQARDSTGSRSDVVTLRVIRRAALTAALSLRIHGQYRARMVVVAVLIACIAGGIGFALGQRHAPQVLQTHAADTLVGFLRVINRRLPDQAAAVRGIAWETYRGDMREHMQAELDANPYPVEDAVTAGA